MENEYLKNDLRLMGLTEEEITEMLNYLQNNPEVQVLKIYNNPEECAEAYIDNLPIILDEFIHGFIDYKKFGEYLSKENDSLMALSSGRIVELEI